jgi:hypothetical protein
MSADDWTDGYHLMYLDRGTAGEGCEPHVIAARPILGDAPP